MATRKFTKELAAEWLQEMRAEIKPGDTITTVLRGVSASGMSRHIDVYRFYVKDGKVRRDWLSPRVAAVCGFTFDDSKDCLKVKGCGMDMGYHVVYSLSRVLFTDGFTDSSGWLSNDGGYALRQEWL
jgi:hypothetical protein